MTIYTLAGQRAYEPQKLSLYAMADQILQRINAVAAQMQVELPERQIIYPSPVPVDCAQVSVLMAGWVPGELWEGFISCQTFKWAGMFSIVITRASPAIPKGKSLPTASQMHRAAEISSQDADVLLALVQSFEEVGPELTLTTGAPEGGFQSVELNVQLTAYGSL